MELPFYRCVYFVALSCCFLSPVSVSSQLTVNIFTPKNICASGEKVFFLCSTNSIDDNQDVIELFFQSRRVLRFNQGTTVYYHSEDRPEGYYSTEIYNLDSIGPIGVGITINEVHTNDSGQYYCMITRSAVPSMSNTISLTVEPIPKPVCRVKSTADVLYTDEGQNDHIVAVEGSNVSLTCQIDADSNSIPISLQWTRSDNLIIYQPSISDVLNMSVAVFSKDDNVNFTCTSKVDDHKVKSFETCHISMHVTNESLTFTTTSSPTISETVFFVIGLSCAGCVLSSLLIILIVFVYFRTSKSDSNRSKEEDVEFINADGNRESNVSRFSMISSRHFQFDTVADSDTMRRNEVTYGNEGYEGNKTIEISTNSNQGEYREDMYHNTSDSNAYSDGMYNNFDSYYGHAENEHNGYGNSGYDQNMYGNADHAENMYGNSEYKQDVYGNTKHAQMPHHDCQQIEEMYQNTDQALETGYQHDLYENSEDRTYSPDVTSQRGTNSLRRPIYAHVNKSKGAPSTVSDFNSDDSISPYSAVERGKQRVKTVFGRNMSQYADVNDMSVPPRSSSLRRLNLNMGTSEYSSVC